MGACILSDQAVYYGAFSYSFSRASKSNKVGNMKGIVGNINIHLDSNCNHPEAIKPENLSLFMEFKFACGA